MTYRDDQIVLRERIGQLERELARRSSEGEVGEAGGGRRLQLHHGLLVIVSIFGLLWVGTAWSAQAARERRVRLVRTIQHVVLHPLEDDTARRCVVSLERLTRNAEPIARVQVRCGDRRLYGDGPYHSFARWMDDQVVDDRDDDDRFDAGAARA